MYQEIVQDFIRAALDLDQAGFVQRVSVPVLIWNAPESSSPFAWGQTQESDLEKTIPSARELLLRGNRLPVLQIRGRRSDRPGEVQIGRDPSNDVVVKEETISSKHARFVRNDLTGSYAVLDLSSTNGSKVNGRSIFSTKPLILFDGDLISFGDSVFLFFYPDGWYRVLRSAYQQS